MGTTFSLSLIKFYRVFSLEITLKNVLQLNQKNFPKNPKNIFERIFTR